MSSAAPRAKTLAHAKVKRQKQIVAVGSVILLALLGYQLPKLLGGSSAGQTTPTTIEATTPAAPGSPLAVAPGKLPDTDRVTIEPQSGQLLSFGLFKSKDPFVQQLSTLASVLPSAPATPATPALQTATTPFASTTTSQQQTSPRRTTPNSELTPATTTSPASTVPFPSTTPVTPVTPTPVTPGATTPSTTTPATTTSTTPATEPTSVAISTNGACENVAVNGTFPGSEDIFRVVSIAKDGKSAKIAVVGGAYDNGQAAATLKLGIRLTLVNTADGTRYVLMLKSRCDTETEPVTGTTTTTSTVAAPAPTTTATTPIVTDALDTTTPGG